MTVRVLVGDCIARLRELDAGSVHCCVTSPPYFALRSYLPAEHEDKALEIGSEPTPEAWAARLVEVFREVRRVLRDDGTVWLNVGDSYASSGQMGTQSDTSNLSRHGIARCNPKMEGQVFGRSPTPPGLKPKDLIGAPWLLAFALRADGWWLRSDVCWAKKNCMPESISGWAWSQHQVRVPSDEPGRKWKMIDCPGCAKCEPHGGLWLSRDSWRPTKSHETVFMLAKSETYFCDAEAVRELSEMKPQRRLSPSPIRGAVPGQEAHHGDKGMRDAPALDGDGARNMRSVWTIATEPFSESHFAVMPTALARRCILAGTSAKGCCVTCGAPWARIVERSIPHDPGRSDTSKLIHADLPRGSLAERSAKRRLGQAYQDQLNANPPQTTGWQPTCECHSSHYTSDLGPAFHCPPVVTPCTVLDPFGGSGTTGLVADQLGRDAILIELSSEYAAMAEKRIQGERARRMIGNAEPRAVSPGQAELFAIDEIRAGPG